MHELFRTYPLEAALCMQRGLDIGVGFSSLSVLHCAYILAFTLYYNHLSLKEYILVGVCFLRILCALGRPAFWLKTRRSLISCRLATTPREMAEKLINLHRLQEQWGIERALLWSYYSWLAFVLIICMTSSNSHLVSSLWRHAWMNVSLIVGHRIGCVMYFFYLMHSDLPRGLHPDLLSIYTKRLTYESLSKEEVTSKETSGNLKDECGICYADYENSQYIRLLTCGHFFHDACVDDWLTRHRPSCPLCLASVVPSTKND